jgi:hypothetical protein
VIAETADVLHIPHYAAEALLKSADWSCEVLLGDKCYKTFFSISVRQNMLCHTKFLQACLILLRLSRALIANIRLDHKIAKSKHSSREPLLKGKALYN